jgi:hypothetical protein
MSVSSKKRKRYQAWEESLGGAFHDRDRRCTSAYGRLGALDVSSRAL